MPTEEITTQQYSQALQSIYAQEQNILLNLGEKGTNIEKTHYLGLLNYLEIEQLFWQKITPSSKSNIITQIKTQDRLTQKIARDIRKAQGEYYVLSEQSQANLLSIDESYILTLTKLRKANAQLNFELSRNTPLEQLQERRMADLSNYITETKNQITLREQIIQMLEKRQAGLSKAA